MFLSQPGKPAASFQQRSTHLIRENRQGVPMTNPISQPTTRHGIRSDISGEAKSTGGKFLTFFLAGEEYGIEILSVYEIIGMMPITKVPGTPDYMRGIINLRGKIIPVVDLKRKFGIGTESQTSGTCIIVVHVQGTQVGTIVDRVSEVLTIPTGEIEPIQSFGKDVTAEYIFGIGKSQGKVKILLNIDLSGVGRSEIEPPYRLAQ
jgi:purine-binding chemotaxis protein CheW